jgi:hypothetical protein
MKNVVGWLDDVLIAPPSALGDLSAWWSGVSAVGATVLPLALALLALAAFFPASCLLSEWTGAPLQIQKGKV